MTAHPEDRAATLRDFKSAVNMTPGALEKWLATGESRAVDITHGEHDESVGQHSGRRVLELLGKAPGDLSEADLALMRKVVGYIHRNLAQRPGGDVRNTRWRWSLMNWGHDPLEP
jgi:hypothetical protein